MEKAGTAITSLTTLSGLAVKADVWIDATYEGDLAATAGADVTWGREARSEYNETGAGRRAADIT